MSKTFDPQSYELASHFLADSPKATDEDRAELARELQQAAEDFMSDFECCRACGARLGFIGAECDETCDHAKAEGQ